MKRWLGVLPDARSVLQLAVRSEAAYAEAARPQHPGQTQRGLGTIDPHLLEDVLEQADTMSLNDSPMLEAALSGWLPDTQAAPRQ